MSLPASTYNTSSSPQMTQLQAGQPNAVNTTPPPPGPLAQDLSSYPSDQALSGAYQTANANLVPFGTASGRQQYVDNSNLPAMQSNYEDLAKKLFEYDQGTLSPKFQGQNPGTPGDAASFGRVDASPLGLTMSAAGLPASSGLFNNNPKYAYAAQTAQGNSLVDLLDTLNKGISGTFGQRVDTYKSDKQGAQDALDSILKIMGLKSDLAQKQAELAASRASKGGVGTAEDAQNHATADAAKGVTFTDMILRYAGKLDPYTIRDIYNQANYYKKPAQETDEDVVGLINGTKPGPQAAKAKAEEAKKKALDVTKGTIQNILGQYNNLNDFEKGGPTGALLANNPYGAGSNYEKQRKALVVSLKDIAGAGEGSGVRVTNTEINTWSNLLPSPGDTPTQVKTKLKSLDTQLKQKFGVGLDSQYLGGNSSGTTVMSGPKGTFNVPNEKVEVFKKNGYK